ncbi:MAG: winged helix-turn-helix domain-containing protein [Syntrophotaleaceae bacterium]
MKTSDNHLEENALQQGQKQWTFLDNHAHVLLCLARNPDMVMREVARQVGITERATQKIVKDLVDTQVLERYRVGRCNSYRINLDHPLRHPLESQHTIGELLAMLLTEEELKRARELSAG